MKITIRLDVNPAGYERFASEIDRALESAAAAICETTEDHVVLLDTRGVRIGTVEVVSAPSQPLITESTRVKRLKESR